MKKYDYSPRNKEEKDFYNELDKVYAFMKKLYTLYGRMRFRGTSFMREPTPELEGLGEESVAEHLFSATMFWEIIQSTIPNTTSSVDQNIVREMIMIHDIGEIDEGDISAVIQLKGGGKNRQKIEQDAFAKLTKVLPKKSGDYLQKLNGRYEKEKNNQTTNDKEVLLAKIMDTIQGDHYVITDSFDMPKNAPIHAEIISVKLFPYVKRLTTIFTEEKNIKGVGELQLFIRHHLFCFQREGGTIPWDDQ